MGLVAASNAYFPLILRHVDAFLTLEKKSLLDYMMDILVEL